MAIRHLEHERAVSDYDIGRTPYTSVSRPQSLGACLATNIWFRQTRAYALLKRALRSVSQQRVILLQSLARLQRNLFRLRAQTPHSYAKAWPMHRLTDETPRRLRSVRLLVGWRREGAL